MQQKTRRKTCLFDAAFSGGMVFLMRVVFARIDQLLYFAISASMSA